jgi:TraM recognition site of TraD and TraG
LSATRRPSAVSLLRVGVLGLLGLAGLEAADRGTDGGAHLPPSVPAPLALRVKAQLRAYASWRGTVMQHRELAAVGGLLAASLAVLGVRQAGGDPVATAQRVFSVLPMGDNVFYQTQAEVMFTNLCRLLHGLVDEQGNGIPFVLRDVSVCLKAIGNVGGWSRALRYCLDTSLDREAAAQIRAQVKQLDREVLKSLSGIVGALDKFQSDIVNAYAPDIIFEDVLQSNGLVYVQLPANLFRIQAPALGKVILMDVQHEGSLRQVFRDRRNQMPFAVTVDEFYNFADLSIVDSLNKLRDANLEYTLAHQSLADLELVSREFATAVWDNTRTKDVLSQDNPDLCERIAKSIGTAYVSGLTVRRREGPLATSLLTGDAFARTVEAYRLHPNCIKNLARCGQGYLLSDDGVRPLVYGMLPHVSASYPLPRKAQKGAPGLRLYETFVAGG